MASKTTAKSGGKSGGSSSGKGRRPSGKPVPIKQPKPWGLIALGVVVALVAVGIVWVGVSAVRNSGGTWEERADKISGIVNFRKTHKDLTKAGTHQPGSLKYEQNPPVAGPHNDQWQNCMGDVYTEPIANEHAVHSLEHGAVWITYKKGLDKGEVEKLVERVQGKEKTMLSPVENQDKNISLQAWGYQLKVDKADDDRIDTFIRTLRVNASMETAAALCSGGISTTGTVPVGPTAAR